MVGAMPRPFSVRPSVSASLETTLSGFSKLTWSGVIGGVMKGTSEAMLPIIEAMPKGRDTSGFLRHVLQHRLETFAEAQHLGAAKLIDLAAGDLAVDGAGDGFGDILDIDRLEIRLAAADQRQDRRMRAMSANLLKKPSSGPKTIDGRKMTASGLTDRMAVSARPLVRP